MFKKDAEYEIISQDDENITVRVRHMGNQTITISQAVGNIILDFDHQQYNSDHRFYRHQAANSYTTANGSDFDVLDATANRASIERTSEAHPEQILLNLIAKEDNQTTQRLISQLPQALATLTDKQRYAITRFYLNNQLQKDIATEMGVSNMMVSKHIKAGLKKLREYYQKQL